GEARGGGRGRRPPLRGGEGGDGRRGGEGVERRDREPPIGRWSCRERSRQRRNGAARQRLDDERARRAAPCEVGAQELLAERTQRRGGEQARERRRRPSGGRSPSRPAAAQR